MWNVRVVLEKKISEKKTLEKKNIFFRMVVLSSTRVTANSLFSGVCIMMIILCSLMHHTVFVLCLYVYHDVYAVYQMILWHCLVQKRKTLNNQTNSHQASKLSCMVKLWKHKIMFTCTCLMIQNVLYSHMNKDMSVKNKNKTIRTKSTTV